VWGHLVATPEALFPAVANVPMADILCAVLDDPASVPIVCVGSAVDSEVRTRINGRVRQMIGVARIPLSVPDATVGYGYGGRLMSQTRMCMSLVSG
jgi:hypothetical protein